LKLNSQKLHPGIIELCELSDSPRKLKPDQPIENNECELFTLNQKETYNPETLTEKNVCFESLSETPQNLKEKESLNPKTLNCIKNIKKNKRVWSEFIYQSGERFWVEGRVSKVHDKKNFEVEYADGEWVDQPIQELFKSPPKDCKVKRVHWK